MIDRTHPLPVTRQARLLELSRSSVYYEPMPTSDADLALMAAMDDIHMSFPSTGQEGYKASCSTAASWWEGSTSPPSCAGWG